MIGKYQIQLGADQFTSGMSSSDYATDGALGVGSFDTNPFLLPGAITAIPIQTDKSTNVADNFVATCEDSIDVGGARLVVGSAAKYYTIDSSSNVTNVVTGSDTSNYKFPQTDIAIQSDHNGNGAAFVTHGTDIAMWNGGATLAESWWTTVAYYTGTTHPPALTANPHPLLNFNTNLWIGDGSQLHNILPDVANISSNTLAVNINVLSLDLFSTIYALGIDPATGLMMISFQTVKNISGSVSSQAYVGLYDGYSTGLRRKIPVDEIVTSFQNVGGTVYMGYGRRLGYWNGNGITFLRQLKNVTLGTSSLLPYKHHVCNVANILLVADGAYLLAYGDVVAGKKGFFYLKQNKSAGVVTAIGAVFPLGNNFIGLACATNKFSYIDISANTGTFNSNCTVIFNNIYFPRPVFVRRMRVVTTAAVHTGQINVIGLIYNEKGAQMPISTGNSQVVIPTGITQYVFDFDFTQGKVIAIQPYVSIEDATVALIRVIIYYDIAE